MASDVAERLSAWLEEGGASGCCGRTGSVPPESFTRMHLGTSVDEEMKKSKSCSKGRLAVTKRKEKEEALKMRKSARKARMRQRKKAAKVQLALVLR